MLNTHFLYLLGHCRLLAEQHSVTSLNRSGIGLIGTAPYNQLYTHAIKCKAHHSELKSVCHIAPPYSSVEYFINQKQRIETLINDDAVDSIIMTSVCSDELLKFAIQASITAGKDILLNNIPNYNENELEELLKQAIRHNVLIDYSQPLTFDKQFKQVKTVLSEKSGDETGLLRFTTHRVIAPGNQLPFNTLRNTLLQNIELLLSLLPDFSLLAPSIQYSHPFTKRADGDVLIINLRHNNGLLISFELFFNTGKISDKLSLKQCNKLYDIEKIFPSNENAQNPHDNGVILNQLDQFVFKLANKTKASQVKHWVRANKLTNKIVNQLNINGFI